MFGVEEFDEGDAVGAGFEGAVDDVGFDEEHFAGFELDAADDEGAVEDDGAAPSAM